MQTPAPVWNSLEVAKLAMGALTPLLIAFLGIWFNRVAKRFEISQWTNQKLTERRLEIHKDVAPRLNDLLCYFTYVGNWKELAPPDVIQTKRYLDKVVHVHSALFNGQFLVNYFRFMRSCFKTFTGHGMDAKLRTEAEGRRDHQRAHWRDEWEELFVSAGDVEDEGVVRATYEALMHSFSRELGVGLLASARDR